MKRKICIALMALIVGLQAWAGGGKLIILLENTDPINEWYSITESFDVSWDFHKSHWKDGRAVISAKHTPLGWCYLASKALPKTGQEANYLKTKDSIKKIKEWNKSGFYVSSVGCGQMDGLGRSYWQIIGTQVPGYTAQECKELGFKSIYKWAKPFMDQGYRITDIAPSTMKWFTVLSKGTDIDRQEWEQYPNYDTFIEGVNKHWNDGWSLQIAEVSPAGKYVGVYCTYADGHQPKQIVTVASTKEEAKSFINKNTSKEMHIVRLGGSYLPGLLCNYDSNAEKMNAIMGIVSGLTSSTAQLASDISNNRNRGNENATGGGFSDENIPSGLSQGEYQGIYDRFARNAESAVNSLTAASVSSSNYVTMKKQLREAQKQMRKTREEARRAGHNITQSKWETVTVKL